MRIIKRCIIIAVFIALVLWGGQNIFASSSMDTYPTVADLLKAGFVRPQAVNPATAGKYAGPAIYFLVDDKTDKPSDAPNLVMISRVKVPGYTTDKAMFSYNSRARNFTIPGARSLAAILPDGRAAVSFLQSGSYTVVIGPNLDKVKALATIIAQSVSDY